MFYLTFFTIQSQLDFFQLLFLLSLLGKSTDSMWRAAAFAFASRIFDDVSDSLECPEDILERLFDCSDLLETE